MVAEKINQKDAEEMNENEISMRKLASRSTPIYCRHRQCHHIRHMQEVVLLSSFIVQVCKMQKEHLQIQNKIEFQRKLFATNHTRMPQHVS